jgi:hypothetical protein
MSKQKPIGITLPAKHWETVIAALRGRALSFDLDAAEGAVNAAQLRRHANNARRMADEIERQKDAPTPAASQDTKTTGKFDSDEDRDDFDARR